MVCMSSTYVLPDGNTAEQTVGTLHLVRIASKLFRVQRIYTRVLPPLQIRTSFLDSACRELYNADGSQSH